MNKTLMIAGLAGLAVGYFAGNYLAPYQPWKFAMEKGASLAS